MEVAALIRLAVPLALVCALAQIVVWLRGRRRREPLWWAAADAIGVVGAILLGLRASDPNWATLTLGNTLIVLSALLAWAGLRSVVGLAVPVRGLVLATLTFAAAFHGQWWLWDDLGARVLTASVALCICNAAIAVDLARGHGGAARLRKLLGFVFAAHALFYLFRAATAMTLEAEDKFMRSGGLQSLTILLSVVKLLLWNVLAVLLLRSSTRKTGR